MAGALPETLLRILRAHPRAGSAELCRLLGGVNRSTLARALRSLEGRVVGRGGSRRIRYALRRELRGSAAGLPVYRIDAAGRGHGESSALQRAASFRNSPRAGCARGRSST